MKQLDKQSTLFVCQEQLSSARGAVLSLKKTKLGIRPDSMFPITIIFA
jgi:hypothetical protein